MVLSGAGAGLAAALLVWQLRQLALPFAFDYVEGMMLYGVRLVLDGSSLYPPLTRLPYVIIAYTPLYYYLCALGTRLTGYGFLFGRLLSLLSMLATAGAIAWMVLRAGERRRKLQGAGGKGPGLDEERALPSSGAVAIALLAASAFCLTLPARNWAVLMRVDAIEVALAIWGFHCALFLGRPRLAAVLFLSSFLVKHTMFAAPAAVLIVWWFEGRRRAALRLAAFLALGAALVFALLGWMSGGSAFVYLFGIHQDPVLPLKWFKEFLFLGRTLPVILALAAWLLVDEAQRLYQVLASPEPKRIRPPDGRRLSGLSMDPVACYLVMSFLSTLYGMKLASFWNHYLEFCAAACLAAGCAAIRFSRWHAAKRPAEFKAPLECGSLLPPSSAEACFGANRFAARQQAASPQGGSKLPHSKDFSPLTGIADSAAANGPPSAGRQAEADGGVKSAAAFRTALAVQCLLVLPLMMPWSPGQWFHGAIAVIFAAAVAWCAWRLWRSRSAALLAAAATLTFPGVWHWSLSNVNLWPSLLAIAALTCLIERRTWAAAAASLAAAAIGASLPPVFAAVAWAFIRGPGARIPGPNSEGQGAAAWQPRPMRIAGLLFVAATLILVRLVSPESGTFHSFRSVTIVVDPQQWLPQLGLLAALALAGALAGAPAFAAIYAVSALVSAAAGGDSRLWLELGAALAVLAAGAFRLRGTFAWKTTATAAALVQLALLSPFPLWLSPGVDAQQLRYIYATVARSPDPVLSEDVGPLAAARKPALVSDPYAARLAQKYFPEEPLLEQLRAGRISQVIMLRDPTAPDSSASGSDPVWSERMIQALGENYRKTREYDIGAGRRYYFFAPKSRQSSVVSRQP